MPDLGRPIPPEERGALGASCELVPFVPSPAREADVVGRAIRRWTDNAGAGGMSGAGFLGFELDGAWLIVAVLYAAQYARLDGVILFDLMYERDDSPKGFRRRLDIDALFRDDEFTAISLSARSFSADLTSGRSLAIAGAPALESDDDLRAGVFLAPTAELWHA